IASSSPVSATGLNDVRKIAAGTWRSVALKNDGTVWTWGYEHYAPQIGQDISNNSPVQVADLTDVVDIAAGFEHVVAVKADGTVWTWGDGSAGTLPGVDLHIPQQVGLGLFDSNHNGIDDRWEMHFLGNLDQSGDSDFDGDGISNRLEYLRGTDPRDYYN